MSQNEWFEKIQRQWSDPATARGLIVVGFLNGARPRRHGGQYARIEALVRDLREWVGFLPKPGWEEIPDSSVEVRRDSEWDGFETDRRVEAALKKYKRPLTLQSPQITVGGVARELDVASALEWLAQTEPKAIDLIRECAGCGVWFYAGRKDQRVCSNKCNHKRPKTDSEKKRHALISNRYYWMSRPRTKQTKAKLDEIDQALSKLEERQR